MIRIIFGIVSVFLVVLQAHALKAYDLKVPDDLTFADQPLVLNGVGMRTKFFHDIYVAALYLPERSNDAQDVIAADTAMNIRIYIVSDLVTGERFSEATLDGFVRSTHGNLEPIQRQVDAMIRAFRDSLVKGDVFDLAYIPGEGVRIYRNDEQVELVPGLAFKQAMFGIWLSDDPVQSKLRDHMLGE